MVDNVRFRIYRSGAIFGPLDTLRICNSSERLRDLSYDHFIRCSVDSKMLRHSNPLWSRFKIFMDRVVRDHLVSKVEVRSRVTFLYLQTLLIALNSTTTEKKSLEREETIPFPLFDF